MARFDINLAPLEHENPFCQAKSELKFFEAAICDVPTIASPTGPFERAIDHGKSGFLATSHDDWKEALELLVSDNALRKRVAREAHRRALWPFGPTRRVELAASILENTRLGRTASHAFFHYVHEQKRQPKPVPLSERTILFEHHKAQPSRVTVIVPLYNYEKYIIEALDTVVDQTMSDIDLVVVDDKSTDRSAELVINWMETHKDRFNRVALAQHTENSGLGATRNTAVDLADSLYVMALDADNKLKDNCCEKLFAAIDHEAAAFAYPTIQKFGGSDGLMGNRTFSPADFIPGNGIDAMAMISKEAWSLVGGYVTHRLGWQDYDLWCRFVGEGLHGIHVPEVLANYRVHNESMLRTATDKEKNKSDLLDRMEDDHCWLSLTSADRTAHRKKQHKDT